MFRITTKYPEDPRAPFYDANKDEMNPLARLYLTRESITRKNCDEEFLQELTLEVAENAEDTSRRKLIGKINKSCTVKKQGVRHLH